MLSIKSTLGICLDMIEAWLAAGLNFNIKVKEKDITIDGSLQIKPFEPYISWTICAQ
jgi:hypothetical protein